MNIAAVARTFASASKRISTSNFLFGIHTYSSAYRLLTSKCSQLAENIAHSSIELSALPLFSADFFLLISDRCKDVGHAAT